LAIKDRCLRGDVILEEEEEEFAHKNGNAPLPPPIEEDLA
jgi:hypothetical protein